MKYLACLVFLSLIVLPGCSETLSPSLVDGEDETEIEPEGLAWKQVGVLDYGTCAIDAADGLHCWAADAPNQPVMGPVRLAAEQTFESLASGCALAHGGTIYCWNRSLNVVEIEGSYGSVSGTLEAGCGLRTVGILECWTGSPEVRTVEGDMAFAAVSVGVVHACGLTDAGLAYCWYLGTPEQVSPVRGRLGSSGDPSPYVAVPVDGQIAFETISVSVTHACALTEQGEAYCWGVNQGMQLGVSTASPHCQSIGPPQATYPSYWCNTPQRAAENLKLASIHARPDLTCALDADGVAYCWGMNFGKGLGVENVAGAKSCRTGAYYQCIPDPVRVSGDFRFEALTTGPRAYHSCGLTADGDALCWGLLDAHGLPSRSIGFWNGNPTPTKIPRAAG